MMNSKRMRWVGHELKHKCLLFCDTLICPLPSFPLTLDIYMPSYHFCNKAVISCSQCIRSAVSNA